MRAAYSSNSLHRARRSAWPSRRAASLFRLSLSRRLTAGRLRRAFRATIATALRPKGVPICVPLATRLVTKFIPRGPSRFRHSVVQKSGVTIFVSHVTIFVLRVTIFVFVATICRNGEIVTVTFFVRKPSKSDDLEPLGRPNTLPKSRGEETELRAPTLAQPGPRPDSIRAPDQSAHALANPTSGIG